MASDVGPIFEAFDNFDLEKRELGPREIGLEEDNALPAILDEGIDWDLNHPGGRRQVNGRSDELPRP